MRLIDADAIPYTMLYKENFLAGTGYEAQAVWKKDIDAMPTIEKRKKGKWEAFMAYGKTVRHRCSECLAVAARDDFGNEYLSDYCSVCGSDMQGTSS